MNPQLIEKVHKIYEAIHQANAELYYIWLSNMLFTWRWWLGVALVIGVWSFWIKYRKKENTLLLLYAGTVSAILAILFDVAGTAMGLWEYNLELIPLIPPLIVWDLSIIPVNVMLTIQIRPKTHPLLKAVILSFIGSFFWQPLAVLIGLYNPKHWKHWYSIPFVIIIYLVSNYVVTRKEFRKI